MESLIKQIQDNPAEFEEFARNVQAAEDAKRNGVPAVTPTAKYSKYSRDVKAFDAIDVYDVHALFGIDDPSGCLQHASKKLLLSGTRNGGKTKLQDITEARDTINRWLAINETTSCSK